MAYFDVKSDVNSISPRDLTMLTQTLEVWCSQNSIKRKDAEQEAKVLLETYRMGKRSQIELIDALVKFQH